MRLRKDDPIYYKEKINTLMKQALLEGLKIKVQHLKNGVKIYFKAGNGDVAGVALEGTKIKEE